jgi:hypothetical protein
VKYYHGVIRPKPEVDQHDEDVVTLSVMDIRFGIGSKADEQDPHKIMRGTIKDLQLDFIDVTYDLEQIDRPAHEDNFSEWLDKQPFGGPSRIPGQRLITDSTIRLMNAAWEAAKVVS